MERHPHHARRAKPRRLTTTPLANIEWLITQHGSITVGEVQPVDCVAAAADHDQCYAMLRRREGETLLELLHRLDKAIAAASETGVTMDEVNPPGGFPSSRP